MRKYHVFKQMENLCSKQYFNIKKIKPETFKKIPKCSQKLHEVNLSEACFDLKLLSCNRIISKIIP